MKVEGSVNLHSIFLSIQGETESTGLPTTFIRFYGCNVGCTYCDQPMYAKDKIRTSIAKIIPQVNKLKCKRVCITGGEPLMQWGSVYPLVLELQSLGYEISIETSGCYPIEQDFYNRSFRYVMDVKCPSSGVSSKNILDNLINLRSNDEVKFVIADREDYEYMKNVLKKFPTSAKILVSPMFNGFNKPVIGKQLAEWLLEDKLFDVRIQLQIHKLLNIE